MIEIINLKPGDVLQTQIAYIFGKCIDKINAIQVINLTCQESSQEWHIKNYFFKVRIKTFK